MKKLLLMSAVLVLAACEKKAEAPAGETTGEMAPAPADTGMGMAHDSATMAPADTMMTRDSAK
jgi:hypothetical protein